MLTCNIQGTEPSLVGIVGVIMGTRKKVGEHSRNQLGKRKSIFP